MGGVEKKVKGAAGHPRCSSAPRSRALRRASFDGRNWSNMGALPGTKQLASLEGTSSYPLSRIDFPIRSA
jgi:hypothetical protein